jgi:hypothetical protein
MENASKALYIAASTLIALMIMFVMIAVFRKTSSISSTYDQTQSQQNIEAFNSKFSAFETDENIAADVVSAVNLAYNVNKNNYYDSVNNVEIYIYMSNNTTGTANYSLLNDKSNAVKDAMFIGTTANRANVISNNDFMKLEVGANTNKFLNDVKYDRTTEKMVYRYHFKGVADYNMTNGKINKLTFSLLETTGF